ncbi:2-amino-4-hydroxy-6-hydroxymethyldihydropteridine diphosphokinase [Marinobacterium aestuariivivens]|uniref:2-amino-4-hydroxy-6-hydroxymethyldihydropteridine pyrophosphokinase n=1 Tax=Marinobacterium aestuariivivens TaxID=1698799 RepID=A0ABW1ZYL5_9GAMM
MYYYLSIGSNIDPETNIARCIETLLTHFNIAYLFPCTYTAPEKIDSDHVFLNTLLIIESDQEEVELKRLFCQIEEALGRDRSDSRRSYKDRTCDIDILHSSRHCSPAYFEQCHESYLQQVLSRTSAKAEVSIYGLKFSDRPAAIYFQGGAGDKAVIQYKANTLQNRVEA